MANEKWRKCRKCDALDTLWTDTGCVVCEPEEAAKLTAAAGNYLWGGAGVRFLTKSGRRKVLYCAPKSLPKIIRRVVRLPHFQKLVAIKIED